MLAAVVRSYREAYSGLSRELWMLSLAMLINRAGSMVLPFLALYLTNDRGLSVGGAGRILALYGIGAIGGSFIGGWAADRIGATQTQQLSLLFGGIGYLWISFLSSIGAIAVGIFCLSVVVEAFRPAVMADIGQRAAKGQQMRAWALLRLAANVGVGIGPVIGGYLALVGYRWLFVADALTCWLAMALLLRSLAPVARPLDDEDDAAKVGSPWRDGPFLWLMSLVVLLATVFFQFWSTLPLYLRDHFAMQEHSIGLLLAVNPALIIVLEMVLIRAVEGWKRLPLIGFGAFCVCFGMALMPFGQGWLFAALTVSIWTLGEMLTLPLINGVVADQATASTRGRYLGVFTMTFSCAFVFAPAGGTWIYETLGPRTLWIAIGFLGPVLWIWALALRSPLRRMRRAGEAGG